jgi:putative transposase
MPANDKNRIDEENICSHIFNRGVENKEIFKDDQDYQTFLGYLNEYLSTPLDPESSKKDFVVNGKVYKGIPHQPKNFFNKINLIAYGLKPNSFHLILQQTTDGSIVSFIRSLSTRYSIYFNKKYQRNGTLFEGPYKSVQLKDSDLMFVTRNLHKTSSISSYPEYLGMKKTDWVKPYISQSLLEKKGGSYKNFVEKYELSQEDEEILKGKTFESKKIYQSQSIKEKEEIVIPNIDIQKSRQPRPSELFAFTIIFFILIGFGITNIRANIITSKSSTVPEASDVLSESDKNDGLEVNENNVQENKEETKDIDQSISNDNNLNTNIVVKIDDESESVNIRKSPNTQSEIIAKALEGETFEYVSLNSGWYEIKLPDGLIGFISAKYTVETGEN